MVHGSAVPGLSCRNLSQSLITNYSRLFLKIDFGELSGLNRTSCFAATMR